MAARRIGMMAVAAVLVALFAGVSAQNRGSPKVQGDCNARLDALLNAKYANDKTCYDLINKALSLGAGQQAQCPPTNVGSPVHFCMNKNDTADVTQAWAGLLVGCDYMYIANRQGAGESETGFTYNDDSCFQRFGSWNEFSTWLNDNSPYVAGGAAANPPQAANMATVAFGTLVAALSFALVLLLQ